MSLYYCSQLIEKIANEILGYLYLISFFLSSFLYRLF